ncbi:MAG: hypothetical protein KAJ95_06135, partial [Gammaproteobacteria bacterium]|nr:hypothetical protein [Gammaproteobacteria bacterium]
MKRLARISVILFSLLGVSVPAQASNGMGDMMRVMMEMFLWMMGGGAGGMSPYSMGSMGGMANPLLAGSMLGNPMPGNSLFGGTSYGLPYNGYNGLGVNPAIGYPGSAAVVNPYSNNPYSSQFRNSYKDPYALPYNGNAYGKQPYYRRDYGNANHSDKYYRPDPPGRSTHPALQSTIINSAEQDSVMTSVPDREAMLQPSTTEMAVAAAVSSTPLTGYWQGVNGEYLELGEKRFRLRSNDANLKGTYELKNSILKAEISDRK